MFGWNILEHKKTVPNKIEIEKQKNQADQLSFRSHLSRALDLKNINFSSPGVSNEHQFRCANDAFLKNLGLTDFMRRSKQIIVLWSITDLHRLEYWDAGKKEYKNIVFSSGPHSEFGKAYITQVFDPKQKALELAYKIRQWQLIFDDLGFKHFWIDLFNTNDYHGIVDMNHFIFPNDNLLSRMSGSCMEDSHYANHGDDAVLSTRLRTLIDLDLVNPVTGHPTASGHEKISDMILTELRQGNML